MTDQLLDRLDVPTLHSVIRSGDETVIETTRLSQELEAATELFTGADDSAEDDIELLIDEVVDRHITALRRDIRSLLDRARAIPPDSY